MSKLNKENRDKLKTNHTSGRKSFVRVMEEKRSTTTNLVEFYKEVLWSRSKDKFMTSTTEELYLQVQASACIVVFTKITVGSWWTIHAGKILWRKGYPFNTL
ncbi:hypothetical protein F2P56_011253 [Juglans regia]|uniref:Uncharacterized protein n=1 Tax=Juglans regia TaxID=51240 RepID=A0A833XL52_JUGRE|nr:hypothetical protein F2P56_011253 [Juglans regia]